MSPNASIVWVGVEFRGLGPNSAPPTRQNPCYGGIDAQRGDRTRFMMICTLIACLPQALCMRLFRFPLR